MAKSAVKKSCGDKFITCLCVLNSLLLLVLCVPFIPHRSARSDPYFALNGRFTSPRYMSPFSVTDNTGTYISWMTLKSAICVQSQVWQSPNPLMSIANIAAGATGVGGAVGGCSMWTECKMHALMRCNTYTTMAYVGLASIGINLIGIMSFFAVPIMLSFERAMSGESEKKKKKKDAYWNSQFNSLMMIVFACIMSIIGPLAFIIYSGNMVAGFQRVAYYPYQEASAGVILGYVEMGLASFLLLWGILRFSCHKDKTDGDAE